MYQLAAFAGSPSSFQPVLYQLPIYTFFETPPLIMSNTS